MKSNHIFATLNENVITIDVAFGDNPRVWRYLALKGDNIEVGNHVVIHNGTSFGVGQVKEVHSAAMIDTTSNIRYKYIVQKVNADCYDLICANQANQEEKFNQLHARKLAQEAVEAYAEQTGMDVKELATIAGSITNHLEVQNNGSTDNN